MFLLRFILASAMLFSTPFIYAQDSFSPNNVDTESEEEQKEEAPPKKTSNNKDKYERVQVTGSLIRRADFEGPSPIEVIDRKTLDDSSHNSVADVLREMPISSTGSRRESSGAVGSGAATVNLRGLGASNTLVLLNGNRLQVDGVLGAVNMNLVPEIAIENVNILKDGASATYGSDAIGGVVALETRKDFTGTEMSARLSLTEESGGERLDLGVLNGFQYQVEGTNMRGSVTTALQYRNNRRIYARSREFSRAKRDGRYKIGWSQYGPTPNYIDAAGNWTFENSACTTGDIDNGDGNKYCPYPFADEATTLPEIEQMSAYLNSTLDIDSRNSLSFTALVSSQEDSWVYAPTVGSPSTGFVVPAALAPTINNGGPLSDAAVGEDIVYTYRTEALGNRETVTTSDSFNLGLDYSREFLETWQWKNTLGYGVSKRYSTSPKGYALLQPIQDAVATGAFNPFSTNPDFSALDPARYEPFQRTGSSTTTATSMVNGELMSFGGNNVLSAAAGAQYIRMDFSDAADEQTLNGEVFGSAGTKGEGYREVYAGFAELNLALGRQLEVQAATRYDKFSDFGDAISPKLGVKYRPTDTLMFRASVGKAFKAPLMTDLYASTSLGFPSFIDHVKCNIEKGNGNPNHPACTGGNQYEYLNESNRNLDAEEATSYNVGAVIEPIRDFAIVLDYWLIDQTNLVGFSLEEMTRAESKGVNPADFGVTVERDPVSQSIVSIQGPTLNLSERVQSGLDFGLSYRFGTGVGRFVVGNNFSYTFNREAEGFPGAGKRDFIDEYGIPHWRNNLSLTYSPSNDHAITMAVNSTAGTKDFARDGRMPAYSQLDLSYNTTSLWKGSVLTVGVRNLAGITPPFDADVAQSSFNSSLYPILQRHAYISLRQSF